MIYKYHTQVVWNHWLMPRTLFGFWSVLSTDVINRLPVFKNGVMLYKISLCGYSNGRSEQDAFSRNE